jgi:hypothetical protein
MNSKNASLKRFGNLELQKGKVKFLNWLEEKEKLVLATCRRISIRTCFSASFCNITNKNDGCLNSNP